MKRVLPFALLVAACGPDNGLQENGDFGPQSRAPFGEPIDCSGTPFDAQYVEVRPGSFTMGPDFSSELCGYCGSDPRRVTLTRGFMMQTTEVTQGQWQALMGFNPSAHAFCGCNCPVDSVNWFETFDYLNALSEKDGLPPCYEYGRTGQVRFRGLDCTGWRLPTEAEWEYAARAGVTTALPNGNLTEYSSEFLDPNLDRVGWYEANSGRRTHPVGQKEPNRWGLYDVVGNVWEWVQDEYEVSFDGPPLPSLDPFLVNGSGKHAVRGGQATFPPKECTLGQRHKRSDVDRSPFLGFRPVRTIFN